MIFSNSSRDKQVSKRRSATLACLAKVSHYANLVWLFSCLSLAPITPSYGQKTEDAVRPAQTRCEFDLSTWKLNLPSANADNRSQTISTQQLTQGYQNPSTFFFEDDGAMVFQCPVSGAKTSKKTKYARTELREMLRGADGSIETQGVNRNNWVTSSSPKADQRAAGGINGVMKATVAVDHVTTTGKDWQVGRVIIGQIHSRHDEPIRLYYRKMPGHKKGVVYFAHEPVEGFGDEQWINLIGDRAQRVEEPVDGIALGERFSYVIEFDGAQLRVTIKREGKEDVHRELDCSNSGFDQAGQYLFFKAGVYNQNNSGEPDDFAQVTFYELAKEHESWVEDE